VTARASARPERPSATLSLDLDNLWCYQRSFGLEAWRTYGSFLDLALPRILDILDELDLRLTLFVIGRDAAQAAHKPVLAEAARRGHEIANHSYDHDMALHRWPHGRIRADVVQAANAIEAATGQRPQGFRGPAYGLSKTLLEVLSELGYTYDASSYPSALGSLADLYQRRQASKFGGGALKGEGFGDSVRNLRRPLRPHRWQLAAREIVEVPVTTLPLLRLPFHGTYLHFLADLSTAAAHCYFSAALALCRLRGVPPSFLLHATDFVGTDDVPGLDFLPGMKRSGAEKATFMTSVLAAYRRSFEVQPIGSFVTAVQSSQGLGRLRPAFGE
jgi:peptidoglycan-N-acetylglucosamine deacetylase